VKRLFTLTIAIILTFSFAFPVPANAKELSASAAGMLLGDLITLISDEYIGGEVSQKALLEAAIRGMTDILDPYSSYLEENELANFTSGLTGRINGLGVQLKRSVNDEQPEIEIMRVLPDTPAREAGLRKGDIIVAVNEESIKNLSLDEVNDRIEESEDEINLNIRRGGDMLAFELTKREIPSFSVYTETLEEILGVAGYENIRYIAVTSISSNTALALKHTIDDLQKERIKKIIIDLRGNMGGYLDVAVDICNMLVPAGPVCYIVDANGNRTVVNSPLRKAPFDQIVVLVDRYTASGAELIAAALQDSGAAEIVGEETFGKGVIQSLFNLPTGGGLKLTTEEYLRPNGEKINEIGVVPDYITNSDNHGNAADGFLLMALELFKK
jgi:carboxyl-terminal processing protease